MGHGAKLIKPNTWQQGGGEENDFHRRLFNKIGSFCYFGVGGRENPQLPKIGLKEHCAVGAEQGGGENPFFEAHSTF